jgi:hypothetical protein
MSHVPESTVVEDLRNYAIAGSTWITLIILKPIGL